MIRVEEIMNPTVRTCTAETDLAAVTAIMRDNDCGMLPVVDVLQNVVGVITDRDVCLTLGGDTRPAASVRVAGIMTRRVWSCRERDSIESALHTMASNQVRRLPVLDEGGRLRGILSMNDIVLRADKTGAGIPYESIVGAFKEICGRRLLTVRDRVAVSAQA